MIKLNEVQCNEFMKLAIEEAYEGITSNSGGPFGAVVVDIGGSEPIVVGSSHNMVLLNHDATAHGEIQAIRVAGNNLNTHDLSNCVLFSTAFPCPMCLSAIKWANIGKVYYGCTKEDTDAIGFRDDIFYNFVNLNKVDLDMEQICINECQELFRAYSNLNRERY